MSQPAYRKKLIEVDLPLDDINQATSREPTSSSRHPWRMQHWWARRRLTACRAVIFGSLVDDPSSCPWEFPDKESQEKERIRLHDMMRELVKWETTDEGKQGTLDLIARAQYEVARSVARSRGETVPIDPTAVLTYLNERALPIYDPFAGGGSIPLEAHRLGLRVIATDLNPVAVLLNRAMIQLPSEFRNKAPINPSPGTISGGSGELRRTSTSGGLRQVTWRGATGLADDIRYYGRWVGERAFDEIGHLLPKATATDGSKATVIAWLWTRTVACPNPACRVSMPLTKTFEISKKRGYWIKPIADRVRKSVSFVVQNHNGGVPENGTVNNNSVTCIACNGVASLSYVRQQAMAGKLTEVMSAIVAEGNRQRLFFSPTSDHIQAAQHSFPDWRPSGNLPEKALGFRVQAYGFKEWHQLFTNRQLMVLTQFSDLIKQISQRIVSDGGDEKYAEVVSTYLAIALGKMADGNCGFVRWQNGGDSVAGLFSRQAISMIWDFAETNAFSNSTKNWNSQVNLIATALENLPTQTNVGSAYLADARTSEYANDGPIIVTDPPYYDNVGYADLSDFYYVWLRPILRDTYPDLFASILTPKGEEIVASPRFEQTRDRFEGMLGQVLRLIVSKCSQEYPSSILYAFKQKEDSSGGRASTGWETMLSALVSAGFQIIGTWPVLTEKPNRTRALGSNALEYSVVLVCRPRPDGAPAATRRDFLGALQAEMPAALDHLTTKGHIAPTDLAQAAIGPGMEIYSRYSAVNTISGEPVSVRDALAAINRAIDDYFEAQEGEIDAESRFCVDWLKQHGFAEGGYGEAELLSKARAVAIESDSMSGLLTAEVGRVKLHGMDDYGPDRPLSRGMTAWEGSMRMAWHLNREAGEGVDGASSVAREMVGLGADVESVERLARILYNHFDRKNDSANAVAFNNVVTSWQDILTRMQQAQNPRLL